MNIIKKLGLGVVTSSLLFCLLTQPVYATQDHVTYETEIVYVTAQNGLNIRTTPGTEKAPVDTVSNGTKLQLVTNHDTGVDNWSMVCYKDEIRYVCNKYISKEKQQTKEKEKENNNNSNKTYLGSYRITYYCNCSACCGSWAGGPTASGKYPEAGVTIATGSEFSYGTQLMINGHIYTVQDRGVGNGCIDIYCSSHSEACAGGMYYTDVYLIN